MLEALQVNETPTDVTEVKEEFLHWLKTPPPWSQLKKITNDNPGISFIEEVKEGFRYHLRRGDMKASKRYIAVRIILRGTDRKDFEEDDFLYSIAKEIAREALADGNAELLNKLQITYGNGESLLGNNRESIRKTFIISVGLLRKKLAKITGVEDLLPSEKEVQKAIEGVFTKD